MENSIKRLSDREQARQKLPIFFGSRDNYVHPIKEAIANACSSANRDTLAFLPILGSGEAILMGVDFPMPVMLKVDLPKIEPNSSTPLFK